MPNAAFRAGPGDAIVELPLTTVFTGRLRRRGAGLHRLLGRVPRGAAPRRGSGCSRASRSRPRTCR
ncbi:MAG: hypothetical protein WDN24_03110 [Sphingomonas sp.]